MTRKSSNDTLYIVKNIVRINYACISLNSSSKSWLNKASRYIVLAEDMSIFVVRYCDRVVAILQGNHDSGHIRMHPDLSFACHTNRSHSFFSFHWFDRSSTFPGILYYPQKMIEKSVIVFAPVVTGSQQNLSPACCPRALSRRISISSGKDEKVAAPATLCPGRRFRSLLQPGNFSP